MFDRCQIKAWCCIKILKMKLLTHNMLSSRCVKGVVTGYPLQIKATSCLVQQVDYNPEFISRMLTKVEWGVAKAAAQSIGYGEDLPTELPQNYEKDDEFLRKAHRCLLEVEVQEGNLICPETGRQFPITKGIPNMLLTEAEV